MPSGVKAPTGGQTVEVRLPRRHPGQARLQADAARFKVVMCGRRWGKTKDGCRWIAEGALAGELCGWFAPEYKVLGDAWRELLAWLGPVVRSKNEQDKRIELVTGGVIECWTLDNPDAGRSRKYHRAVVDEAGLVADLLTRWRQAIRPTLVDYQGAARFYGTPKGRRSGFVALFARGLDAEDPEWSSHRAPTLENPYIPAAEIEAARKDLTPEEFAQEFEAIPMDDGANPFGLDRIADAVLRPGARAWPDVGPGGLSAEPAVVYGCDLARALDYTVLVGLDAWGRVCHLSRWQAPWATTVQRVLQTTKAADGRAVPVVTDATGVGDAITADLSLQGALVTPYVFSQPSKTRLMQRLITAFQAGTVTLPGAPGTPTAAWLRTELESFEFTFTASGVKYEAPPGLHDDGVMALGLAWYGWDRVQGAAPDAPPGSVATLLTRADDPRLATDDAAPPPFVSGDFSTQFSPAGW